METLIKSWRLIITDTAKADLSAMYEYIKPNNPMTAKRLIKDLTDKLFSLAESGITGFSRDDISLGLKAFPYQNRCFYFRIIDDAMVVVRVLHGRQDIKIQAFPFE